MCILMRLLGIRAQSNKSIVYLFQIKKQQPSIYFLQIHCNIQQKQATIPHLCYFFHTAMKE